MSTDKLIDEFREPLAKPEWLETALDSAMRTFRLAREGKLPKVLTAWMLVTSCLHVLRAVFGDDLTTCIKLREHVLSSHQRMQEIEREFAEGRAPKKGD